MPGSPTYSGDLNRGNIWIANFYWFVNQIVRYSDARYNVNGHLNSEPVFKWWSEYWIFMNWAPEWRTIQLANKSSLSEFRTSLLFRSPTVFKTPCHTAIPKWMPDLSPPLQSSHLWRVNNLILFEVHVSGSLGLKKQDWFKNIFKDCGGLFKILFCIYAVQCTRCIQLKKYIL